MVVSNSQEQETRQFANLEKLAGPLIKLIQDPTALDVCVNADGRIWTNRLGVGWACAGTFPPSGSRLLIQAVAALRGIPLNHASPILEAVFPLTGDRIEGIVSPVVNGAILAIRSRQKIGFTLADLKSSGVLTHKKDPLNAKRHRDDFLDQIQGQEHADVLRVAARYRRNVLFAGPTGSGKSTLANSFMSSWVEETPNDRVCVIEDTPELNCGALLNHVQLLSTANISQADLLVAALRLIPKRIIVGEIREENAARVLLSAFNTGHSGLCTIHADDALSSLRRLETLLGDHTRTVRERIASAISLVVFIDADEVVSAGRKVREVMVIRGLDQKTGDYAVEYV